MGVRTLSCLQEMTRNVDGLCITPSGSGPVPTALELEVGPNIGVDFASVFASRINASGHTGSRAIGSTGGERMIQFCNYVFRQKAPVIIAGGHSLFFKSFFKYFYPKNKSCVGKEQKIVNGGAVAF